MMMTRRDKLLNRPWQLRRYNNHRKKVLTALPAIDFGPPPERNHVTHKLKKMQWEEERRHKIEEDNFKLLQRMGSIMKKNRLENHWETPPPSFLHRVGIYHRTRSPSPVKEILETPPKSPETSKRKWCLACSPSEGKTVAIPEERVPWTPPKSRLSRRSSSTTSMRIKSDFDPTPMQRNFASAKTRESLRDKQLPKLKQERRSKSSMHENSLHRLENTSLQNIIEVSQGSLKLAVRFPSQAETFVSVQYPGIVRDVEAMLATLGGIQKVSETISEESRRMQLWFRPNDRFSKPVNGNRKDSNSIIMKYLAVVNGVNVYNQVTPSSLDTNWFKKDCPCLLIPPVFSRIETPQSYHYEKDKISEPTQYAKVINSSRRKRFGFANIMQFEDKEVPSDPRQIPTDYALAVTASADGDKETLRQLFAERPIYSKTAIAATSGLSYKALKTYLPLVAYHFQNGPWRAMWVRLKYDPRTDPSSGVFQTLDFRIRKPEDKGSTTNARRSRGTINPRMIKKPGVASSFVSPGAHIFTPGLVPPYSQFFYQICDILVPEVQNLLATSELRTTCDTTHGWWPDSMLSECRRIMNEYIREAAAASKSNSELMVGLSSDSSNMSDSDSEPVGTRNDVDSAALYSII